MLPPSSSTLEPGHIWEPTVYEAKRSVIQSAIMGVKKHRRLHVGPIALFLFENWHTLWWQIQEMLRIEKGGDAQIEDEIAAYSPLVPKGQEWVATMMLEIEDPAKRRPMLCTLHNIEKHLKLHINDDVISPTLEKDDVSDATGKTPAVHFLRFPFTSHQKSVVQSAFSATPSFKQAVFEFTHPLYCHKASVPLPMLSSLCQDL